MVNTIALKQQETNTLSSQTTSATESLIARGLSINMRSINLVLSELFQRYSIALSKITGGELVGRTQVKQVQDINGVSI